MTPSFLYEITAIPTPENKRRRILRLSRFYTEYAFSPNLNLGLLAPIFLFGRRSSRSNVPICWNEIVENIFTVLTLFADRYFL